MRDHVQIITDAGGPAKLAPLIVPDLGGDAELVRKRVWAWFNSRSIPGEYWPLLSDKGVATVEELAAAAEAKKLPEVAALRQGAAAA